LVEDGVNAELREKSATVVDEVKSKTMIKITGAGLESKIDSLRRERQLVSLAAASHAATVSKNFKKREIIAAFSASSKSVRDQVDIALRKLYELRRLSVT
jgi:hypothetical protein